MPCFHGDLDLFLGFHRLVLDARASTFRLRHPARELVDNNNLAIMDDVLLVQKDSRVTLTARSMY